VLERSLFGAEAIQFGEAPIPNCSGKIPFGAEAIPFGERTIPICAREIPVLGKPQNRKCLSFRRSFASFRHSFASFCHSLASFYHFSEICKIIKLEMPQESWKEFGIKAKR
jgi:hypothetical protein